MFKSLIITFLYILKYEADISKIIKLCLRRYALRVKRYKGCGFLEYFKQASKMESSRERKWKDGNAVNSLLLLYLLKRFAISTDSFVISGLFFVMMDFIFSFLQAIPAKKEPAFLDACFLPKPSAIQLKISR